MGSKLGAMPTFIHRKVAHPKLPRNGTRMRDFQCSCVKLYAQQHFTSCFIVYLSITPVLVITESISASIFCSLPSSPESRIHQNFSRQISDDDV
ncbi:hypothetical protein T05_9444 [Trichinella murrelli]|uniref:Uncharacterized protein n=1 Tax=Trichinella murrelli TaxID=144512 RepID=A0A0V0UE52_9BILA|nr:hypothetical protein T05_9444 [Trichinella murrelli]